MSKPKINLDITKIKEKLYNRALRFLSFRARSQKEVADYLQKKLQYSKKLTPQLSSRIQKEIITKLKKINLVNDVEFTAWWIEQRMTLNPKGNRALSLELRQKGIDQKIIDQQIKLISSVSLKKAAQKIIEKKIKFYPYLSGLKLKKKLFSFLLRRGFDYQLAQEVIDENLEKE